MRGIAKVHLPAATTIAAPRSGVNLGVDDAGDPVTLRLFRPSGTRVTAISALAPVQLLVMRAAHAGVVVRVVTPRPRHWQRVLAHGSDAGAVAPSTVLPQISGPQLVVDDRLVDDPRDQTRGPGDAFAWRCRIELRSQDSSADPRTRGRAELLLLGELRPELTLALATGFGVAPLVRVPDAGSVTVLRRGGLAYVTLDPTPDEAPLLQSNG